MKILILGGTEDARELADALVARQHEVITSYAGRTSEPLLPQGVVRSGGFGGAGGLRDYILAEGVNWLVDATHPYAVTMAANAVEGARLSNIPMIRLIRAPWPEPENGGWVHAATPEEAAIVLPAGARALLTIGHRGLEAFLGRGDCSFVVRTIEPPQLQMPAHAVSLLARPPFFIGGETELMQREAITHLVSKNSGGVQTGAKLAAAQQLGVTVVMIARPALPPAKEVSSVGQALAALHLGRS